jgi:hypothetical protein
MRKSNKFDKVFLVGLIPLFFLAAIAAMFGIGIFYASNKSKTEEKSVTPSYSEHVCPKREKIYVHDTVYIKVPQLCNKQHVQLDELKTPASNSPDAINDTNGTENREN